MELKLDPHSANQGTDRGREERERPVFIYALKDPITDAI